MYLVVDDEPLALKDVKDAICEVKPECEIVDFTSAEKALEFVKKYKVDVAFLDIELGRMNGLTLAKKIKDIQTDIHIIFVTSHEKYAIPAFRIHATGYLLKPVHPEAIARELTFIYGNDDANKKKHIYIQTFGGFSIFVNNKLLTFKRQKSKELLACLVDRHGSDITTRMACAYLWEDAPYDYKLKNYFQSVLLELRTTLKEAGIEDILVRSRNSLAVDVTKFECDSYSFMEGDPLAVNSYRNNYLCDYSWAEFMKGDFEIEK